jgi:hypothetical protein
MGRTEGGPDPAMVPQALRFRQRQTSQILPRNRLILARRRQAEQCLCRADESFADFAISLRTLRF